MLICQTINIAGEVGGFLFMETVVQDSCRSVPCTCRVAVERLVKKAWLSHDEAFSPSMSAITSILPLVISDLLEGARGGRG